MRQLRPRRAQRKCGTFARIAVSAVTSGPWKSARTVTFGGIEGLRRAGRPVVRHLDEADGQDAAEPRGSGRRSCNAERRRHRAGTDLLLAELLEEIQVPADLRDVERRGDA